MKTITFDESLWKLVPIEPTDFQVHMGQHGVTTSCAIAIYKAMLAAAPEAAADEQVKMHLTSGEDGVFAHFQIGNGYQCGVNLDHIELCKRFCDEYRAMLSAAPEQAESKEGKNV
jgi:hypothetical protein